MTIKARLTALHDQTRAFLAGFALGAAFMASPALGLALAVMATIYLAVQHQRDRDRGDRP